MAEQSKRDAMKHLPYLDGLRGLLAVYVLVYHFLAFKTIGLGPILRTLVIPFRFGHSAVGFFIVLSGYSLMLPVAASADRNVRGGFAGYLYRRARRIFPAYYAALAISIAVVAAIVWVERPEPVTVQPEELSFASVASHLFLVHTLVPGQTHTINGPLWSVATEWHIYFLFPTLLLPVWRRFGPLALLTSAFAVGLIPQLLLPSDHEFVLACPWYLGLFAMGMVAAEITARPGHPLLRGSWRIALLFAGSVVACLGLHAAEWMGMPGLHSANPKGVPSLQWLKDGTVGAICACLLIALARPTSRLTGVLSTAPLVALGGLSYSLYATHFAVMTAFNGYTHHAGLGPEEAWRLRALVGLPVAVALAYGFSIWFERPFLGRRALPVEKAPKPQPRPEPVGVA